MNPDIGHLCILGSFARSTLYGPLNRSVLDEYWNENGTWTVFDFVGNDRRQIILPRSIPVAFGPAQWIQSRVMRHTTTHVEAGFRDDFWDVAPSRLLSRLKRPRRNSEGWFLQVYKADHVELWVNARLSAHESFSARRNNVTRYVGARVDTPLRFAQVGIDSARTMLRAALDDILQFAKEHGRGFEFAFADALQRLSSPAPESDFQRAPPLLAAGRGSPLILAPGMHSLQAHQLVSAACSADYVFHFGGMMSWNDHGPEDVETMRRDAEVTQALRQAIVSAMIAGVNSSK